MYNIYYIIYDIYIYNIYIYITKNTFVAGMTHEKD